MADGFEVKLEDTLQGEILQYDGQPGGYWWISSLVVLQNEGIGAMFLSVRQKSMREEALNCFVIDSNTGEKIPRVVWANEETGRYRQRLIDESGNLVLNEKETDFLSKIFTGNIKIVKKDSLESTP